MTDKDLNIKAAVRVSRAIEASAIVVTIGLIFISIALAQGTAQVVLGSIGVTFVLLMNLQNGDLK